MKEFASIIEMCLLAVYEKGEDAIKTICNCKVPSDVMMGEYRKLKIKIDDLPKEEKEEMWQVAYQWFPNKSKEERLNVCKIIHTTATLL